MYQSITTYSINNLITYSTYIHSVTLLCHISNHMNDNSLFIVSCNSVTLCCGPQQIIKVNVISLISILIEITTFPPPLIPHPIIYYYPTMNYVTLSSVSLLGTCCGSTKKIPLMS